ncbi:lambda family phage portal protein [Comamonas odontotermitis]|uniref:Lambda family phage portal protein n=1 Tax=Comamonas odontotermitis TaxID=379895 RepID=A0ABR6RH26_9BURK|nr:phage portal protein [Comamonas odontotermitis]MBB6578465.1 lambda family phage portal protein [Comamonas odontotermitis]
MNWIEQTIASISPRWAMQRAHSRHVLAHYEAARPSKQRISHNSNASINTSIQASAGSIRAQARDLERNHDIVRGALRVLVNNVVGAAGIGVEPQPRMTNGEVHEDYAAQLRSAWALWQRRPEVTRRYHWGMLQRLTAYTWLRDGEAFGQMLSGPVDYLRHSTSVPFSLEMMEPDFIPLDLTDPERNLRQGIQCNAWGQPVAYHCYKGDPRETYQLATKTIPAERMLHVATIDRLHQYRGMSELSSVITRLEDLKDFEESERIAAKVAASLTAYVKRTEAFTGNDVPKVNGDDDEDKRPHRELEMMPGMIIDTLQVGEEIGMIDTKRPNPNLVAWRAGQLKAVAAGMGASYSSISRDYDGTYSAQRQELVEQWVHYAVLADEFVGMLVQPVWEAFVRAAHLSGVVRCPKEVPLENSDDALYIGQAMPWIDPYKEAVAMEKLVQAGFASEVEAIRKRGQNPRDVMDQTEQWRKDAARRGLRFTSNAASMTGGGALASNDGGSDSGDDSATKNKKDAPAAD